MPRADLPHPRSPVDPALSVVPRLPSWAASAPDHCYWSPSLPLGRTKPPPHSA